MLDPVDLYTWGHANLLTIRMFHDHFNDLTLLHALMFMHRPNACVVKIVWARNRMH